MKHESSPSSVSRNSKKLPTELVLRTESSGNLIQDINTTAGNQPSSDRTGKKASYWQNIDNSDIFLRKKMSQIEQTRREKLIDTRLLEKGERSNSRGNIYLTEGSQSSSIFIRKSQKPEKNKSNGNSLGIHKFNNITFNHKFESVKDYINKTKQLIFLKFSMKQKEERMDRIRTSNTNELESIRESIFSMESAKKSFEVSFLEKYDNYARHLSDQIHKENNFLEELQHKRRKLEDEVRALEYHKSKTKDMVDKNNNFKFFMVCVRERKINFIPKDMAITKEEKSNDTKAEEIVNQPPPRKRVFKFRFSKKRKDIFSQELINTRSNNSLLGLLTTKILSQNFGDKIYEKQSDLLDDLKLIEHNNMLLLERYNYLNHLHTELMRDNKEAVKKSDPENDPTKILCDKKQKKLEKMVEKYNFLNKEKEKVKSSSSDKNLPSLNFSKEGKFVHKLVTCYKVCLDFFTKKFYFPNHNFGLNRVQELSTNVVIEVLKFLEKNFEFLYQKLKDFQQNLAVPLREFERELELERKKKLCIEQKIEIQQKTEQLSKQILERINRVNVIQGRRIVNRQPPLKKVVKQSQSSTRKEESEFLQFLQY